MLIKSDNFNLKQIADSGQCFRFNETGDGSFRIIAFSRILTLRQQGQNIELSCDEEEWNGLWREYFDMDTDYSAIGRMITESDDKYLMEAYNYGSGIRILKQDLFETIISFMISQNNNIPRIKSSIEKICTKAGIAIMHDEESKTEALEDDALYAFPLPGQVDPEMFMDKSLGLGYRSEYLKDMYILVENNPEWLTLLKGLSYEDALRELLKIRGIGKKVANCICLFSLHHVEAFPIDTHIKQIISEHYPDGFRPEKYKGVAGIVQQYMFYHHLKHYNESLKSHI